MANSESGSSHEAGWWDCIKDCWGCCFGSCYISDDSWLSPSTSDHQIQEPSASGGVQEPQQSSGSQQNMKLQQNSEPFELSGKPSGGGTPRSDLWRIPGCSVVEVLRNFSSAKQ